MSALSALLETIDSEMPGRAMQRRCVTLRGVTGLFLASASQLNCEQVDAFDAVILRLSERIETRARAELAENLADIENAPRRTIMALAHDDIIVAKPVLERSPVLCTESLQGVIREKGRDHMLAIATRANLPAEVTDMLVGNGQRIVLHAVSANHGARFSNHSMASLIERARNDEILECTLRGRGDIPPHLVSALIAVAKETARQRLAIGAEAAMLPVIAASVDKSADEVAAQGGAADRARRLQTAAFKIQAMVEGGSLDEAAIAKFARKRHFEECVCALAAYCVMPVSAFMRAFLKADRDFLLVAARSKRLEWPTVAALLPMMNSPAPSLRQKEQHARDFERLQPETAGKILVFLQARDALRGKRKQ